MMPHVGTHDGKILPKNLHDKKISYTFGLQVRFKMKLLLTDYQNYAVPKLEKKINSN